MADQIGGSSGNAGPSQLLTGYTASNNTGPISGSMANNGSVTLTPSGTGTVTIPQGYHDGTGKVSQVAITAGHLLSGDNVAGVAGTMPNNGALNYSPSTAAQNIPAGYITGGSVAAVGGSATDAQVLSGYGYSSAVGIGRTGSMPNNGAPTLQPGQSISPGYYSGGSVGGTQRASGTATISGSASPYTLTISGLSFQPNYIVIEWQYPNSSPLNYYRYSYITGTIFSSLNGSGIGITMPNYQYGGNAQCSWSVSASGFTATIYTGNSYSPYITAGAVVSWWAWN